VNSAADGNGGRRLEQLYEISKLFAAFDVVEHTLDAALKVIADKIPLESAILIEAAAAGHAEMIVWPSQGGNPHRLYAAKRYASAAYAYLAGVASPDARELQDEVREELGPTQLPAPARAGGEPEDDPQFIVIPLVVGRGAVFGALQLEGAARLDRYDLEFVNAVANQLAIAIDRSRAWGHDVLRRRDAQRLQVKYETLVDDLDDAFVWEADLETRRITYVSAQIEQMLGFSRQACVEELGWWSAHVHPADRWALDQTFVRAIALPDHQRCEHRCVTADGSVRWLRTSIHRVGGVGEPPYLRGVSFDITAARTAQDQVHEQLMFTRAMASGLAEGTLALDLDQRITFINEAAAELLGCTGHDVIGMHAAELLRVESAEGVAVESPVAIAIRTARVRSDARDFVRADGRRFSANYTATPLRRDGQVTGVVLAFGDITARKHAQETEHFLLAAGEQLGASLESTATLTAAVRIGIPRLGDLCFLDTVSADDEIVHTACAHYELVAQDELQRALGTEPRPPVFPRLVVEVIASGRSQRLPATPDHVVAEADLALLRQLGVRRALCVPLTLGARQLGALTFCMTGARQHREGDVVLAEELGRRTASAIEHARLYQHARQAVALREQTLAIVSHDLRSPLSTIVMAASILGDDDTMRANPRSRAMAVDKIESAASRMDRMIGDLLDFASIEAGRLSIRASPHEVDAIVGEAITSFDIAAVRQGSALVSVVLPGLPTILCDRDRILQVLANLIGNALKSVASGGWVEVRAKLDDRDVVFSVSDTGPGIARAEQARLFERYWRSPKAGYKGTGLGLAIARGLVEAHNGRLWVDSEPGHGATFSFTVPRSDRAPGGELELGRPALP